MKFDMKLNDLHYIKATEDLRERVLGDHQYNSTISYAIIMVALFVRHMPIPLTEQIKILTSSDRSNTDAITDSLNKYYDYTELDAPSTDSFQGRLIDRRVRFLQDCGRYWYFSAEDRRSIVTECSFSSMGNLISDIFRFWNIMISESSVCDDEKDKLLKYVDQIYGHSVTGVDSREAFESLWNFLMYNYESSSLLVKNSSSRLDITELARTLNIPHVAIDRTVYFMNEKDRTMALIASEEI